MEEWKEEWRDGLEGIKGRNEEWGRMEGGMKGWVGRNKRKK